MTAADAVRQAVRILEVATALHCGRISALEKMGLTEPQALRLVQKRYRGAVGHWLGKSLDVMLPQCNPTARAGQIALDLSLSGTTATKAVELASEHTRVDVRHVWAAFKRAKLDEEKASVRRAAMRFSCQEPPVPCGD